MSNEVRNQLIRKMNSEGRMAAEKKSYKEDGAEMAVIITRVSRSIIRLRRKK